jgi:hypothetical protein
VKWDVAVPSLAPSALPEATGIERCECSREYNGTSCQNPARGYYRWRKPNFLTSENILDLVGIARPCHCNGHAQYCDKESGACIVSNDALSFLIVYCTGTRHISGH